MYNDKMLNSVQTWLPDFSAIYHDTKFGMASGSIGEGKKESGQLPELEPASGRV